MKEYIGMEELGRLIIAYSCGYEHGHYDTVDGVFTGDARSELHDKDAYDWLESAQIDGTFDRKLNI